MTLLLFLLASAGLTGILCYGSIFDPLRKRLNYDKFTRCPMCQGFWAGLAMSAIFGAAGMWPLGGSIVSPIIGAFTSSAFSYAFWMLIGDFGIRHDYGER